MMKSLSEFELYGFDEVQIIPFLAKHGINIGELSETQKSLEDESFPEWKRVMALLPHLTDTEAASAFVGIDLKAPGWLSDDDQAELSRWQSVICRAIRVGEIVAIEIDFERDGTPKEWSIDPTDLAAWCEAKRWPYPLPGRISLPATDAGLRDALINSERERAQWKTKAEALEALGDQRKILQAEIDKLRGELRTKADELATQTAERDALKVDALAGKAKSTALKIIGGLVGANYKTDIYSDRLDGIGAIVEDLETVGAGVSEKTLREWIKEAANVIDKPRTKR